MRPFADEDDLVSSLTASLPLGADVLIGPGDDCAVIDGGGAEFALLTVDQVVAGVHYDPQTTSAAKVAAKLVKRNVSDIAAMGGQPRNAVLAVATANFEPSWLEEFFAGIAAESRRWGVSVCGGDLARTPGGAVFSLTLEGTVARDKLCLRSGARDGQALCCTGLLGNSYHSGHHLDFTPRLAEAAFLAGTYTNTMIDISDGLARDARRLARSSKVGVVVDVEKLPRRGAADIAAALGDGEDYELLFTIDPELAPRLVADWPFPETPLTVIGAISAAAPGTVRDRRGDELARQFPGYDHFEIIMSAEL